MEKKSFETMPIVETTAIVTAICVGKTAITSFLANLGIISVSKAATVAAAGCVATTTTYIIYGSVSIIIVGGAIVIKLVIDDEETELQISNSLQNYIDGLNIENQTILLDEIKEWINLQRSSVDKKEAIRAVMFIDYVVHPFDQNIDRNIEISEVDPNKWICCICYEEEVPENFITLEPCNHARMCFKCDLVNNLTRLQKGYLRETVIVPQCPLDRVPIERSSKSQ